MSESREILILKHIVRQFIASGAPVGSRTLSKLLPVEWSAATIRNVMADLEERGLLGHPHKSAGRIPTDRAYRFFVDSLMEAEDLTAIEKKLLRRAIDQIAKNVTRLADGMDEVLFHTSRALAAVSQELGIILAPRFDAGVVEAMRLDRISDDRVVVDLSLTNGLVKTVVLQVRRRIEPRDLHEMNRLLAERLSGLTVREVRETLEARLSDAQARFREDALIFVRVLIESAVRLFDFEPKSPVNFAGTQNILTKPEFVGNELALPLLQMLEDRQSIARILSSRNPDVQVTIGEENEGMSQCSIITAPFFLGEQCGTVGIIGPTRMPYAKMVSLVQYTAHLLETSFNQN